MDAGMADLLNMGRRPGPVLLRLPPQNHMSKIGVRHRGLLGGWLGKRVGRGKGGGWLPGVGNL